MLFKMKNIAPLRVLHSLYYALFHSHLSYGICVWGNATNEALQPLGIAQNKIVGSYLMQIMMQVLPPYIVT